MDSVAALSGVGRVTPVIATDVIASQGSNDRSARLVGIEHFAGGGYLNTLQLLEGEWPQQAGEVVAVHGSAVFDEVEVGDTFSLKTTTGTYQDVYAVDTVTVVGVVSSPVTVLIVGRGDDAHHRDRIDRTHVLISSRGPL